MDEYPIVSVTRNKPVTVHSYFPPKNSDRLGALHHQLVSAQLVIQARDGRLTVGPQRAIEPSEAPSVLSSALLTHQETHRPAEHTEFASV